MALSTIMPANSVSGGYEISNSLRFNDGDTPRLTRTPGADGNKRVWTISTWLKRGQLTTLQTFFSAGSSVPDTIIKLTPDDQFEISRYSGGYTWQVTSSNKLRDPSAWYHLVGAVDTTQGTAGNRIKLYINNVQVSSFAISAYPDQNFDTELNDTNRPMKVGSHPGNGQNFDGYMAETHFIDGTQLAPTNFGEVDDNGEWIPKAYTGSYGTNGFYMEFKETGTGQNSSGMGADTSGNDNHFAVTNLAAPDVVIDTPTNNFATFNPLAGKHDALPTLSQGNLSIATNGTQATISMPSGKWYMEALATSGDADYAFGITEIHEANTGVVVGAANARAGFIYQANSNVRQGGNGTVVANYATYTNGDILSFSYDTSNRQLKAYKNNSLQGTLTLASPQSDYIFNAICLGGSYTANFGQDSSFAGAKTAQGNTDDNDQGDFYYAVPTGFYSLCTKNLAEFG